MAAKLDTVEDVTDAIVALYRVGANEMRGAKRFERQLHAAHLADLHEIRARLFREMDLSGIPSGQLNAVAFAASQAAELDDRQAAFFRGQAGAR